MPEKKIQESVLQKAKSKGVDELITKQSEDSFVIEVVSILLFSIHF
jgi:hypothetical protein